MEVIVTTWPPDVVTIWAAVGVGVVAAFEEDDDDCAAVAEEDADDAVEAEDDEADDVSLDVVVAGAVEVAAAAVVEGLDGALHNPG